MQKRARNEINLKDLPLNGLLTRDRSKKENYRIDSGRRLAVREHE